MCGVIFKEKSFILSIPLRLLKVCKIKAAYLLQNVKFKFINNVVTVATRCLTVTPFEVIIKTGVCKVLHPSCGCASSPDIIFNYNTLVCSLPVYICCKFHNKIFVLIYLTFLNQCCLKIIWLLLGGISWTLTWPPNTQANTHLTYCHLSLSNQIQNIQYDG